MPTNLPLVPVLCIAKDQTGAPLAGGKFEARLDRTDTYSGFVVPLTATGIADADGACVLHLFPNVLGSAGSAYRVRAWSADTGKRFLDAYAAVPNAPCTLEDILIATAPPDLDMAVTAAASAAASAAEAEAAADRAEAAAGGGGGVDPSGALLFVNRLSEFADRPADQAAAQTNLGLGISDPLAYYILAKA